MYILYIQPENAEAATFYTAAAEAYNIKKMADRDAGFDLFCASDAVPARALGHKLTQNVRAAFYDTDLGEFRAFWLLSRSSISKTAMRLANSVGLIDAGYRGTILAVVDNHSDTEKAVGSGDRYFQLAAGDLLPWHKVEVVAEIPGGATLRGEGGFGSTGLGAGAGGVGLGSGANYII